MQDESDTGRDMIYPWQRTYGLKQRAGGDVLLLDRNRHQYTLVTVMGIRFILHGALDEKSLAGRPAHKRLPLADETPRIRPSL